MTFKEEFAAGRAGWELLTLYQKFEHAVILLLTALIAVVVALAVWNLALKVGISIISSGFDPTDYEVFQAFFGMIFTVIIALEFKRSLLVVAERRHGVVQVRTVVLIALLAVVRKLMIIDLSTTDAQQLLALSAAIVALGSVHWLVRDQDRRDDAKAIQDTAP
ncbi:MAG: phosphate-starvation-inducible PsiE family protein [Usitatibacter sp.]